MIKGKQLAARLTVYTELRIFFVRKRDVDKVKDGDRFEARKTVFDMGKKEQEIVSRYKTDESKVLRIKKYFRKINFKEDKK